MPPSTFLCHEGKPCFVTETWDHLWRRPSVSTWSRRALLLPWSRRARRGRSIRCSSSPFLASVYNISVAERYTINLAKRSPVAWPLFLYDIFFPEAVAVLAACAEWLFCGWCSASLHGLLIIFVLRLRWKSNVTAVFLDFFFQELRAADSKRFCFGRRNSQWRSPYSMILVRHTDVS